MKENYKIFKKIIYVIVFLVIVLLVWSVLPTKNGPKLFVVLSGSMEPTIHIGSVIVTKPASNYKVGDIITFGENTKIKIPTTHRIAEIRTSENIITYRTKGDANDSEDSKRVLKENIIGKVYFSVPYLGYILNFIKKPIGLILVIVIPSFFIIYDEVEKIIKEIKKIKSKKLLLQKNEKEQEQ